MPKHQGFISKCLIVLSAVFMLIGYGITDQSDSSTYWKNKIDLNGHVKFTQTFLADSEG
jgi:hypothetical protein